MEEGPLDPSLFDELREEYDHCIANKTLYLQFLPVGRFSVSDGNLIRFERHPDARDDDIRVYLLGSGMGSILQQRRKLTLHASSVVIDGSAVSFTGPSGAGKSTTMSAFVSEGYGMLTDDVSLVEFDEDYIPHIVPSYAGSKLNEDSAQALAMNPSTLRWVNRFKWKYAVEFPDKLVWSSCPLKAIFVIDVVRDLTNIQIEELVGYEKFAKVHGNTYRQNYHAGFGVEADMFNQVGQVTAACHVFRLKRPYRQPINPSFLISSILETLDKIDG